MIATALFFDVCKLLLQLIPVAGQVLAIVVGWFAFGTFWLWFTILGAKYSKGTMMLGFISDFIPFADVLSETATILALYIQSKGEKVVSSVPGGKAALQMAAAKKPAGKVSYTHADGSINQNGAVHVANRQPLPERQYTPGVAEMPKRNSVDPSAARQRLEEHKKDFQRWKDTNDEWFDMKSNPEKYKEDSLARARAGADYRGKKDPDMFRQPRHQDDNTHDI
jgi:hypothetical protein